MRHFIVATKHEYARRGLPGRNIRFAVYEMKKNIPVFRCMFEVCTASWKGGDGVHDAMNALARHVPQVVRDGKWVQGSKSVIPAKYRDGYYQPDNPHFRITAV